MSNTVNPINPASSPQSTPQAVSHVTEVTDANFDSEVLKSNLPVLVDFFATWCSPCRSAAPMIDQIATDYSGRAKVVKVDVDENPQTTTRYRVTSIPTVIVFKDGQEVYRMVGIRSKGELAFMLNDTLKSTPKKPQARSSSEVADFFAGVAKRWYAHPTNDPG